MFLFETFSHPGIFFGYPTFLFTEDSVSRIKMKLESKSQSVVIICLSSYEFHFFPLTQSFVVNGTLVSGQTQCLEPILVWSLVSETILY